ncbi:MAG: hypothetical protein KDK45_03125, partial [Leptospiraceae bacterium]|nr:hypothetical protein [Leptospiraceae bacterium]
MRHSSRRKKASPEKKTPFKQTQEKRKPCRALVIVDNKPIRQKAAQKAKRAIKELEKANLLLETFNTKDIPAYSRWFNYNFGKELTSIRELQEELHKLEYILNDINFIRFSRKMGLVEAFLYYEEHKNEEGFMDKERARFHHEEMEDDWDEESEYDREDEEEFDEDDWEREFGDWDEEEYEAHFNPNKTDEELKDEFKKFIQNVLGIENPNLNQSPFKEAFEEYRRSYKEDTERFSPNKKSSKENKAEKLETRLKDRYRSLARILHPDLRKDKDSRKDQLWYDTIDAYEKKDIEKLDMVLALCDLYDKKKLDNGTSISDILNIAEKYKTDTKLLRSQIRRSKKDPAWDFTNRKDKVTLKRDINFSLRKQIHEMKDRKEEITAFFNDIQKEGER